MPSCLRVNGEITQMRIGSIKAWGGMANTVGYMRINRHLRGIGPE